MSDPRRISALPNELVDVTKDTWLLVEEPGASAAARCRRSNLLGAGVGFHASDPNAIVIAEDNTHTLQLSTEVYDDWAALDSDDFIVPLTGLYHIELRLKYTNQAGRINPVIRQGAGVASSIFLPLAGSHAYALELAWTTIVRLTKGQNVKFQITRPDDGDGTLTLAAGTSVKCHLV